MLAMALAVGVSGCSMQMTITPGLKPPGSQVASSESKTDAKPESKKPAEKSPPKESKVVATKPGDDSGYLPDSLIDNGSMVAKERDKTRESEDRPSHASVVNVFGEFSHTRKGARSLAAEVSLKQHTFTDSGFDADVDIDVAGETMVYASARDGEQTQIYSQKLDAPAVVQLTNNASDNAQPSFSPDGKRVAFASNRTGQWHLYVMNIDGRSVVQLTQGDTNNMHPSFSPDGTRLVYSSLPTASGGAGEQWQLWTIDLVSRQTKMIGYGLFPAWSPERKRDVIAFQKTRAKGSRWFSLWTCELHNNDEGEPESTAITEVAVSTNAALVSPSWSPDGRKLAFVSIVEPAQTKNGKPQGQQEIWSIDADGNNRKRLSDGTSMNLTPCWAVDNRIYFISDRSGHECIWSLPTPKPAVISSGNEDVALHQEPAPVPRPATRPREKEVVKDPDSSTAANEPAEIKP